MKETIRKYEYRIELENGKQNFLEYNNIVDIITKDNEEVIERWTNKLAIFSQQPREGHINIDFGIFWYLKNHLQDKIHFYPQQINTEGIYFSFDNEWQ